MTNYGSSAASAGRRRWSTVSDWREPTTCTFTTSAADAEVQHLDVALQLLALMGEDERQRALNYLNDRFPAITAEMLEANA